MGVVGIAVTSCQVYTLSTLPQTIGAAFGAKKVSIAGESVTLGIWVSSCRLDVFFMSCFFIPGYSWIRTL